MTLLVLGLIIFLGLHSIRIVAEPARDQAIAHVAAQAAAGDPCAEHVPAAAGIDQPGDERDEGERAAGCGSGRGGGRAQGTRDRGGPDRNGHDSLSRVMAAYPHRCAETRAPAGRTRPAGRRPVQEL